MGLPAATEGCQILAVDTHIVLVPSGGGPIPTPLPHNFSGRLDGSLVPTVKILGRPAAVVGSTVTNRPAHTPTPPGTSFQRPPANRGKVAVGSATVKFGGRSAARANDRVWTCNDPADLPNGTIVAAGSVRIG